MRVTGNRMIELSSLATSKAQSRAAEAAEEVSSGVRVSTPSDDPSAWLAAHRAKLRATVVEGNQRATQFGNDRLTLSDSALANLHSILSEAREIAVQGTNATYDATARGEMGVRMHALFDAAVAAGNTRSPDGEYLLAGSKSLAEPFDTATGAYRGDAADRSVPTSEAVAHAATIPGSELTAANGVDVIPLLSQIASALDTNDVATLRSTLDSLGTALTQVGGLRSRAGGMMSTLSDAKSAQDIMHQNLMTSAANYIETNLTDSASELAKAGTALEVSKLVSSRIAELVKP